MSRTHALLCSIALLGVLASSASAGLIVDDSLNRYSLYGRTIMKMEHGASTSQGGWIGSDSLVQIDATDTLRSTVTSGKDFQINNGGDWIWGDVRVANDMGSGAMYNDSVMGTTYVGRNLSMADLNILKKQVYTGGLLTVSAWSHNYCNGSDFFNNSVSTTFSSPFRVTGLTWGVQPQATPYSAWTFPDTTFSASSISIATSFTTAKDASGKYRWTCGSNAQAGGSDLVALHICSANDTILPPGNYGDMNLWYGSTLFLGEGTYAFNNITLPPSSGTDSTRLLAHQPNGLRTAILVKGKLDAQTSSRLNVIAPENYLKGYGTDAGHFAGATLMIYADQPVSLGVGLELWATLVVPKHSVTLNENIHLFGQILADSILVKNKFKGTDGVYIPYHPGQKITFTAVAAQNFGTTPTLTAASTSGFAVSFTSSTTDVCTVTSGGVLTFITAGTCTINADQAGGPSLAFAPTVSRSFTVMAVAPSAPTIGTATAGDGQASVSFTVPANNGGAVITSYTVTSNPEAKTLIGSASPITITGLTNGTAYTFTVTATNSAGTSMTSAVSNSVTPVAPQTIAFGALPSQTYGTLFVKLTATASSSLPVNYASANTAAVRISNDTAYLLAADTATITASQAGSASYQAASPISQTMTIAKRALTITDVTANNKVYDATTTATLASITMDKLTDDVLNLVADTVKFTDKNAGTEKFVLASGFRISGGTDSANYVLASGQKTFTTADITPKTIHVIANADTITQGASGPTLTYVADSLLASDTWSGALSREAGDTAGTYAILIGTLSAGGNYTIDFTSANLVITAPIVTPPETIKSAQSLAFTGRTNASIFNLQGQQVWSGTLDVINGQVKIPNIGEGRWVVKMQTGNIERVANTTLYK